MSNDWHFSHKNEGGYDVNAYGYDKDGVFRGTAPFKILGNNQLPRKKLNTKVSGIGGIIGLLLLITVIIFIIEFMKRNWVSVIAITGVIILCIVFNIIIRKKSPKKAKLPLIISIIVSIGLIIGIIYLGPIQNDGNFKRWSNNANSFAIY